MENKDEIIESTPGLHEKVLTILEKYVKKRALIFDLGSGYGDLSINLKNRGYNIIALDHDASKFQHKKAIPIVKCDFNSDLPLKKQVPDCIISVEVIEHLENPWNFVREIKRVLKDDGIAIITLPNFSDFISKMRFLFLDEFSYFCKDIPKDGHITILPYWLLNYIFSKNGIRTVELFTHRTWMERFYSKSIKHKLLLSPFFLISLFLKFILRIINKNSRFLDAETLIFIIKKQQLLSKH